MNGIEQMNDAQRLETLEHALRCGGMTAVRVGTGGGCEALEVWLPARENGRHVLVTNGDAGLPYLVNMAYVDESELDESHPLVDEEMVACVYADVDSSEELSIIIDHDGQGILPVSVIVAAVRSALVGA